MADVSQWRSSEYSERAEELFAEYVRARRAGGAPSFEEFCAQHEEFEDELSGLMTDWENIGGVVERLLDEALPPAPPAAVQAAEPEPPIAAVDSAEPAEPLALVVPASPAPVRARRSLAAVLALAAACGTFAFLEWRGGRALAAERDEIAELQRETAELADRAVQRSTELSAEITELGAENSELAARAVQSERESEEARRAREAAEERERAAALEAERLAARAELAELASAVGALAPQDPGSPGAIEALYVRAADLRPRLAEASALARLDQLAGSLDLSAAAAEALRRERALWDATAAAIAAHPDYAGLELRPQAGLAPLGPDPVDGRFEFAHLATGSAPLRRADGALELAPGSGLVLALVPAAAGRAAFFLARAPMDEEQWARAGGDPALDPADATQLERALVLARVGLAPATAVQLAAAGLRPAGAGAQLAARALER